MTEFDYSAPAELYAAQGRRGFRYRRFFNAGEASIYKPPGSKSTQARWLNPGSLGSFHARRACAGRPRLPSILKQHPMRTPRGDS